MRYSNAAVIVLISVLTLSACGEGDQGTGRLTEARCTSDGLCMKAVGSRSIEFGYREGAEEVRLDVIYRRWGSQLKSGRPYSVRIIQQDGRAFSHASCGSNPDSWGRQSSQAVPSESVSAEEQMRKDIQRGILLNKMLTSLKEKICPSELNSEAWEEAKEQLEDLISNLSRPASEVGNGDVVELVDGQPVTTKSLQVLKVLSEDDLAPNDVRPTELGGQDDEEVDIDEFEAHLEAEEAVSAEFKPAKPKKEILLFGSFDGLKKQNIDYSEHHDHPELEFRQELELWNLNTKTFFWAGWPSKKHHSSVWTRVFSRPVNSQAPWQLHDEWKTRNHGSRPSDKRMHHYATCTDFPVTQGYFNWKGECDGVWLTGHLCNDDTAYQVWHAFGEWNGGRHCIGKKRSKRPSCGKPW